MTDENEKPQKVTNTQGGAYIEKDVNVSGGGDFVGGNKVTLFNFIQGDTEQQRRFRNRQNMLNLVYNTWVEGVLKKSLYNEVRLELGLETRPEAIDRPWDTILQMPDQEPRLIPPGKTMLEVFQEASQSLLILGEPGSGKTTMLLELAMQAIECAKENAILPIPVILNLSSWEPKQTIAEWLIEELKDKYYIAKKMGSTWVEHDELMLLLDGLDEVKPDYRLQCVEAINSLLEEHTLQIAVCCRKQEYEALAAEQKLKQMRSAVLIQPLSVQQIDKFLQSTGKGLENVYHVLKQDGALDDFFQTPLALSILVISYCNASAEDIATLSSAINQRKQLFDIYIEQMLRRRGQNPHYADADETRRWLAYLAYQLMRSGQSLFYVESMDQKWLPSVDQTKRFLLLRRLIVGLIGGLSYGLSGGLIGGMNFGLSFGLMVGLSGGMSVGLIFGLSGGEDISYKPTDRLVWSWKEVISGLRVGLILGLFFGLYLGLILGLNVGLIAMLIGVLIGELIFGLSGGLSGMSIEGRIKPEQGIQDSLKNAVTVGLICGLIIGLISGLIGGLRVGLIDGLISGLLCGLITGLIYGGAFVISHYLLRWTLYRDKLIPWNLVSFFDYCADRIFLRKVGGGYIFIHRMLMEHFAEMEFDQPGQE